MPLEAGDRIDRYVLVERLGRGGQGEVWKVEDPLHAGAPRAVKLVQVRLAHPTVAERMRREAHALARLSHPSLVECHGLFEDLRLGVLGLVMDCVPGTPLDALLDDPRLTRRYRVALLWHLAKALAYLHDQRLVHRDVKPSNVLVDERFWQEPDNPNTVKLVDFGIVAPAGNPDPLTREGRIVGTAAYMAPELLEPSYWGRGTSEPAADVFSLGVVAWQLLVGCHPTGLDETADVTAFAIAYRDAAWRGSWPDMNEVAVLGESLNRLLSLRPEDRPLDGTAALAVLRTELREPSRRQPQAAKPFSSNERVRRSADTEPLVKPARRTEGTKRRTSAVALWVVCCAGAVGLLSGSFRTTEGPSLGANSGMFVSSSAAAQAAQARTDLARTWTCIDNECEGASCDESLDPSTRIELSLSHVSPTKHRYAMICVSSSRTNRSYGCFRDQPTIEVPVHEITDPGAGLLFDVMSRGHRIAQKQVSYSSIEYSMACKGTWAQERGPEDPYPSPVQHVGLWVSVPRG